MRFLPSRLLPPNVPAGVWIAAVLAAVLHILPFWIAELRTPPGWTYHWSLSGRDPADEERFFSASHDQMQYRAWMRQAALSGIIVPNKFTSEPNRPHLPVVFYYTVGKLAQWFGAMPEKTFAYIGCILAFVFVILLFSVTREFLQNALAAWWVFGALLLGGGLAVYLKLVSRFDAVKGGPLLSRLFIEPLGVTPLPEDYADQYVFITLFDTHSLLTWLVTTAAILAYYLALKRFSAFRAGMAALLTAVITILHLYEGVLLIAIFCTITAVLYSKGLLTRERFLLGCLCTSVAAACLAGVLLLQKASGLPMPVYRQALVLFSFFVLAYALPLWLIARGFGDFWRNAGLKECFLAGWALGCGILTLSGPFYPYAPRGTMTLQIPLFVMAGAIYFARRPSVSWRAALAAVLLMGVTPVWAVMKRVVADTNFDPAKLCRYTNREHHDITTLLAKRSDGDDVLLTDGYNVLWLGPEYSGVHYCSHVFLTVDFARKYAEMNRFFDVASPEQQEFLRRERIRFVFAANGKNSDSVRKVDGLVLLKASSAGSLFEFLPNR
jgi:hypothetical protein